VVLPRLLLLALPIAFTWEMLQMPAFAGLPESWLAAGGVCAVAAIGDALIVLAMYGFGAYLFRDPRWFVPPSVRRYAVIVAPGLILQLLVEWIAVHRLALWSYRDVQPVLPGLGLGLAHPSADHLAAAHVLAPREVAGSSRVTLRRAADLLPCSSDEYRSCR
jgi:hypothetical protein